jgi:hypothetical protein
VEGPRRPGLDWSGEPEIVPPGAERGTTDRTRPRLAVAYAGHEDGLDPKAEPVAGECRGTLRTSWAA